MKTKNLPIDLLETEADTQSRAGISEETVEDYAEVILQNNGEWPFPPLDVFHDGSRYMMADGFHRVLASRKAKRASAPCRIHVGTACDARIFGMTANDQHGLRMSREDKRACVEWLLDEHTGYTQAEIAEKAGVGVRTVRRIVAERREAARPPEVRGPLASSGPDDEPAWKMGDDGEEGRTDSDGTDSEELAPSSPRSGTERTEAAGEDGLTVQRSKTVKTAEALLRAFDDLQALSPNSNHKPAIKGCATMVKMARAWK